jgi:hypothetical protein
MASSIRAAASDQHLTRGQAETPSLFQDRRPGKEFEGGTVVTRADRAQMVITTQNVIPAAHDGRPPLRSSPSIAARYGEIGISHAFP